MPSALFHRIRGWFRQSIKAAMRITLPRRFFLVSGPSRASKACLTFDDGPHPEHTPRILDVLRSAGVPATFFLIGQNVDRHPELVKRIAAEGHAIGHHTYTHSLVHCRTGADLVRELRQTDESLTRVLGSGSILFRPPWGKLTASKFFRLVRGRWRIILWNKDPKDCDMKSARELSDWFSRHPLRGGDIVLMHDDQPYAAAVLPDVIAQSKQRGVEFTTPLAWQ